MDKKNLVIQAPNLRTAVFKIIGVSPLVMNKFSQKAREMMRATQESGSKAKKGAKKDPKDFKACYEGAIHRSVEGWVRMPASAFRSAMISACKLVGFAMTRAKIGLFVLEDGRDADEGMPLVKIIGKPHPFEAMVKVGMGKSDIRVRPMFDEWSADLKVRFDTDIFSDEDIANLLMRAGLQVGIGEGRNDSPMSEGQGWGAFQISDGKK
jgi:hypothetical protein